jgi:hypothetical protein
MGGCDDHAVSTASVSSVPDSAAKCNGRLAESLVGALVERLPATCWGRREKVSSPLVRMLGGANSWHGHLLCAPVLLRRVPHLRTSGDPLHRLNVKERSHRHAARQCPPTGAPTRSCRAVSHRGERRRANVCFVTENSGRLVPARGAGPDLAAWRSTDNLPRG